MILLSAEKEEVQHFSPLFVCILIFIRLLMYLEVLIHNLVYIVSLCDEIHYGKLQMMRNKMEKNKER